MKVSPSCVLLIVALLVPITTRSQDKVGSSVDEGTWTPLFSQVQYGRVAVYDAPRDRMLVVGSRVMALPFSGTPTWTELNVAGATPETATAIYDPKRDRVVTYGGDSAVWTLSLKGTPAWSQVTPTGTPPPSSYGPVAMYDPARDRMLVFVLPAGVWALSLSGDPAWTEVAAAGTPPPGPFGFSVIYDPVRDRAIVFGGDDSYLPEAWSLSLSGNPTWTDLATTGTRPLGFVGHSAIYDPLHDRMVVFGGRIFGAYAQFKLLALNLSGSLEWTELVPTGRAPQTRAGQATIYDPLRARMVIYGGDNETNRTEDTWTDTWALSLKGELAWTAIEGAQPSPRNGHTAIYDPRRDRMLVFGGRADRHISDPRDDLPSLSLSGTPRWTVLNAGPSPELTNTSAIYDPSGDRMVVCGGSPAEVWQLSLSGPPKWAPLTPSGTPPPSSSPHGTIYDPVRDRMLVLGGTVFALSLSGSPEWSEFSPSGTAPGGLDTAIYDPMRDRVLLFGGTEVWALSLSGFPAWAKLTPTGVPTTAGFGPGIYDPVRDRVVIYSGRESYNGFFDVWALSLHGDPAWAPLVPEGTPPGARYGHTAIYDPVRDRMIIYGGIFGFYYEDRSDTWALEWGAPLDTTPPRITVSLSRDVLWPANHKLVNVCATVKVMDTIDPNPSFALFSITSNETGSGKKAGDITGATIGTPDLCYDLRAERDGGPGGRAYQIIYQAEDASNNVAYDTVYVRVPANMSVTAGAPQPATGLSSIHPNPFNPETTVEYSLESAERVVISIYNVQGSLVRRLVDETTPAGEHRATWDGTDDAGRPASSGMYFVRMIAGSHTETRKIVMLK